MITHRLRLSGLVGAVIAWLLLLLSEFICAQTLPNDEPDAYKPSASTDRKKITISDERVLPEISLGGMRPGSFESFILEVDTKLVEKSECIQIAKSCGCTQVSLLEGNTIKPGEKLKIALRIEAGASLGVRESQFYLAFRTPEGYVPFWIEYKIPIEELRGSGGEEIHLNIKSENLQGKFKIPFSFSN